MAATDNPFRMSGDANTVPGPSAQHGSAEQGQRRSYFDSMGGDTPVTTPRNTSPRRSFRPRARSVGAAAQQAEDAEYEARREERRESRNEPIGMNRNEPIGMNFRMNACETSLRSHNDELAAQRLMIQQLTEAVQRLNAEKETNVDKLNDLVTLVDHRFTESQSGLQEIRDVTHKRFETITGTMTNIANEIVQKLDVINQDIELLKRNSQAPNSQAPPAASSAPPAPPS